MEIPEINMISDFEAGMKCLQQNPSLISRVSSFSANAKLLQVYSFWKWGALIFAIFATFTSLIKRFTKLVFIYFRSVKPQYDRVLDFVDFDDDISLTSDDDDDDDDDDFETEEEETETENSHTTPFKGQHRVDEDFSVKGSWQNGQLRQRRRRNVSCRWPDFTSGKNVVKLWDSLTLSLNFDEDLINRDYGNIVSFWDFDQDEKRSEYSGEVWNIPPLVMTAEKNQKSDGVVLSGYDTRMPRRTPALYAEWQTSPAAEAEVRGVAAGSVGKVYVRDELTGELTVGDVRNVRTPLKSAVETDGDTWWDADAVIVEDEFDNSW